MGKHWNIEYDRIHGDFAEVYMGKRTMTFGRNTLETGFWTHGDLSGKPWKHVGFFRHKTSDEQLDDDRSDFVSTATNMRVICAEP